MTPRYGVKKGGEVPITRQGSQELPLAPTTTEAEAERLR